MSCVGRACDNAAISPVSVMPASWEVVCRQAHYPVLCTTSGFSNTITRQWPSCYVFLFLKRTADVLAPRLSVVFRRLLRLGSFPASWRQSNVTPISKRPSSSSVANYRPISIKPVLSEVSERLVAVRLGRFMDHSGVLPSTQFADRKGFGTCDALLCVSHTLQSALKSIPERASLRIIVSVFCTLYLRHLDSPELITVYYTVQRKVKYSLERIT